MTAVRRRAARAVAAAAICIATLGGACGEPPAALDDQGREAPCASVSDCRAGLVCYEHRCRRACADDFVCGDGYHCVPPICERLYTGPVGGD